MRLGHSEKGRKGVYGDRGYRGCEGVIVCDCREMRAKRQGVEGVISQIKLFNAGCGWRTLTCVLVVRAFRERKRRSVWFRKLVESCVVYGDRGYRGCEGVIVHVGFDLQKLDPDYALESLRLFEELLDIAIIGGVNLRSNFSPGV